MKRFYSSVEVGQPDRGPGWTVRLDSRPVRTPGKALLALPTRALAEAVAEEWEAQEGEVEPHAMPLMSLACTAIDLVVPRRPDVVAEIADFGETDMICYWTEDPPELAERQRETWQPLVDWAALELDAPLQVTTSILPQPQSEDAVNALARAVERHDDFALSGLATAVKASGSLVVGLALSHGRLTIEQAFDVAELDASFQIEKWGEDREAAVRRESVVTDLTSAARFLAALRP